MATFRNFEQIDAWKNGRQLVGKIYEITNAGQFSKNYALSNQIRKSAISIISNIAEAFERDGQGEFIHFLSITKGSAGEVWAQ